jgi:hypothetical protein
VWYATAKFRTDGGCSAPISRAGKSTGNRAGRCIVTAATSRQRDEFPMAGLYRIFSLFWAVGLRFFIQCCINFILSGSGAHTSPKLQTKIQSRIYYRFNSGGFDE